MPTPTTLQQIEKYLSVVQEQAAEGDHEFHFQISEYDGAYFATIYMRWRSWATSQEIYRIPAGADLRASLERIREDPDGEDWFAPLGDWALPCPN